MSLRSWIHTKLETHKDWVVMVGLISAVFTILGITMNSMLSPLLDLSISFSEIIAFLNTIITLLVIHWGLKQKTRAIKEADLRRRSLIICQKLTDQLKKDNKEKQNERLALLEPINFHKDKLKTKKIDYQLDMISDITTPEEIILTEISPELEAIKREAK